MEDTNPKLFNFPEYWRIAWRRKFFIILPFISVLITVYILTFFLKPVYESSTTLMIAGEQFINRNMEAMLPGVTNRQHTAKIIKSKVMSRTNLLELIKQMKFKEEKALQAEARLMLEKYPGYTLDEIMDEILLDNLRKLIIVENVGSEYITIRIQHNRPERAFQMVKYLSQIFIDSSLKNELGGLKGVLKFGDEQLQIYTEKMNNAEDRLRKYEEKIRRQQVENFNISSINLEDLNSRRVALNIQIEATKEKLQNVLTKCTSTTLSREIQKTTYTRQLKQKIFDRSAELEILLPRLDWKDPKVIRLKNEIVGLKGQIGQELFKLASEQITDEEQLNQFVQKEIVQLELTIFKRELEQLNQNLNQYKKIVASDPSNDITRQRLQEELNSFREIYKTLLQQRSGSQIQQALKQTKAKFQFEIVEPPFRPLKPVKPKKIQLLLMGAILGLMIGIVSVFIVEYTNNSFKNIEEVEHYLGLIVLGTIPKIKVVPNRPDRQNLFYRLKLVFPALVLVIGAFLFLPHLW